MKEKLLFIILVLFSKSVFSQGFFKPVEKPLIAADVASPTIVEKWEFRPTVALPALKLVQSTRSNGAQIDGLLFTSTGGGVSLQKLKFDSNSGDNKWKSTFSWSPIIILLSGNLSADNPVDVSYAMNFGFFNNLLTIGGGYDFGAVGDRSRFFAGLSLGISLNN